MPGVNIGLIGGIGGSALGIAAGIIGLLMQRLGARKVLLAAQILLLGCFVLTSAVTILIWKHVGLSGARVFTLAGPVGSLIFFIYCLIERERLEGELGAIIEYRNSRKKTREQSLPRQ